MLEVQKFKPRGADRYYVVAVPFNPLPILSRKPENLLVFI